MSEIPHLNIHFGFELRIVFTSSDLNSVFCFFTILVSKF